MNCFEWQNRASDYVDGTLIGQLRRQADEHLESCEHCRTKHSRFLTILAQISSQPRSALPVPLRKAPLSLNLPRLDIQNTKSRWQDTPWFIRTGVEGLGIATLIILVIAMVPKIRSFYDRSVERRLEAFTLAEINAEKQIADSLPPTAVMVRGKLNPTGDAADPSEDDFAHGHEGADDAGDTKASSEQASGSKIKVGNSEIWRFNLKTDSPHQIRPKIVKTLSELKVPPETPGFGGVEAPGGIQFDLFISQSLIPELKQQLQTLASANSAKAETPADPRDARLDEAFTWYKNKSKRPVPSGKARVVIWLSQM